MALRLNKLYEKVALFYDDETFEAGLATLETADEAIEKGSVCCNLIGGTSGRVNKCPTTGVSHSMPIGVALTAAAGAASTFWLAIQGKVQVLPETDITATHGNVLVTSPDTAGRAAQYSTVPASDHWDEVGHWAATGSGNGVLTLAHLHFN